MIANDNSRYLAILKLLCYLSRTCVVLVFRWNFLRRKTHRMSFPIVHSMVSYSVYRMVPGGKDRKRSWKEAAFFAFVAMAADLDFIPGVLVGQPLLFHHSITHSIGFAFIFGLAIALLAKIFKKASFLKLFLVSSAVYATHPLFDLLTSPERALFWPFQSANFAQQFMTFQSLPLCRDGLKDFACELFLNFSCVQRFWSEIFFLTLALTFFFFRVALRRLFSLSKRRAIFTGVPVPCAD